jgi:hypothetical protein
MGTRLPGRSWPYPRRAIDPARIDEAQWRRFVQIADLAAVPGEARLLRARLRALLRTMTCTLDGRLVSEAAPRPAEIRDPLVALAIPGAVATAEYLANLDERSLDLLLEEGLDAVDDARGVARRNRRERESAVRGFSSGLRDLLGAMAHVRATIDRRVEAGRPDVVRRETQCIVAELAVIWVELAEAPDRAFDRFVAEFFAACGLEAPPRSRYARAVPSLEELRAMTPAERTRVQDDHRRERERLVASCSASPQLVLDVASDARQAARIARALGLAIDGEIARWRELADRGTRTPARSGARPRQRGPGATSTGLSEAEHGARSEGTASARSRPRAKKRG